MKPLTTAIVIGILILLMWATPILIRRYSSKNKTTIHPAVNSEIDASAIASDSYGMAAVLHRRIISITVLLYGVYLSTLTGTVIQAVIPGIGAIGGGAVAGAGIGILTYLVIGTVGAVTGGVGFAIGALAMSLIGASVGAAGGAAGGIGFKTLSYPLVSPWLWAPIMVLGVYFLLGSRKKKRTTISSPAE